MTGLRLCVVEALKAVVGVLKLIAMVVVAMRTRGSTSMYFFTTPRDLICYCQYWIIRGLETYYCGSRGAYKEALEKGLLI